MDNIFARKITLRASEIKEVIPLDEYHLTREEMGRVGRNLKTMSPRAAIDAVLAERPADWVPALD